MSGYAVWTEVAIWVLVVGAPLVFLWFLGDAARLLRGLGGGKRREVKGRPEAGPSRGDGRNDSRPPGL